MKLNLKIASAVAVFATFGSGAARADQSSPLPTCGQSDHSHGGMVIDVFPIWSGNSWSFSVLHNCPSGTTAFGEIQVSVNGGPWQDVQGVHSFFTSGSGCGSGDCNHTFNIVVPCSNPNLNKRWRGQFFWNFDHLTTSAYHSDSVDCF